MCLLKRISEMLIIENTVVKYNKLISDLLCVHSIFYDLKSLYQDIGLIFSLHYLVN